MFDDLSEAARMTYIGIGNSCVTPIREESRIMSHAQVPMEYMADENFVSVLLEILDTQPGGEKTEPVFGYVTQYFACEGFFDLLFCKYEWGYDVFINAINQKNENVRHGTLGMLFGYSPSRIEEYIKNGQRLDFKEYHIESLLDFDPSSLFVESCE